MSIHRGVNFGHLRGLVCDGLFQRRHIGLHCSQTSRLVSGRFLQRCCVSLNIVQNFPVCRLHILHSCQLFVHCGQRSSIFVYHRPNTSRSGLDIRKGRLHTSQCRFDIRCRCFHPLQCSALFCESRLNIFDRLKQLREVYGIFTFAALHGLQFFRQSVHLRGNFIRLFNEDGFLDAVFLHLIVIEDGIFHVAGFRVMRPHGDIIIGILHLCAGHRGTPRTGHRLRCNAAGGVAGLCDQQTILGRHRNAAIVSACLQKYLIAVFIALCQIRILPRRFGVRRGTDGVGISNAQQRVHRIDRAVNLVADFDLISQFCGWVKHRVRGRERLILDAVQHRIQVIANALTGIGAVVYGDFKPAVVAPRVGVSVLVRHGDFGHNKPFSSLDISPHKRNMNKALFSFYRAGLVIDQQKAIRRDNAVELVVHDWIDLRNQRADAAADFRGLNLAVAGGQLPRKRGAVAGDDVVELLVHDVVVFSWRRCQCHQPEFALVGDGPVAAVASANPAQHLLHGISFRERDHVVHAAVDAGARVNRDADAIRNFLHNNRHRFGPVTFAVRIVNHRLRGLQHRIIAGERIQVSDVLAGIDPELTEWKNFCSICDVQIRELRDDADRCSFRDFLAVLQQHIQFQRRCIAVANTERFRCKAVTDLWRRNTVVFFARNDGAGVHVEASASCKLCPVVRSVPRDSSPPYCSVMLNAMPT